MFYRTIKNENNKTKKIIYLNYSMSMYKERKEKKISIVFYTLVILIEKKRKKREKNS
jgi:hypothetical protein